MCATFVVALLKERKIKKKRPGLAQILEKFMAIIALSNDDDDNDNDDRIGNEKRKSGRRKI